MALILMTIELKIILAILTLNSITQKILLIIFILVLISIVLKIIFSIK
jgi:hypothetical protein